MPVPETPENDVCAICRAEITQDAEDPDERPQFLACGHRFHVICIKTYARVAGTTIHDIGCPNCSLNESDINSRADALMSETPGPVILDGPNSAEGADDAETIDGDPADADELAGADEHPAAATLSDEHPADELDGADEEATGPDEEPSGKGDKRRK